MENILAHNEGAAATWGSGGQDYDRISEFVSDALTHLVNRIDPRPGERFLDVATGTGWTARLLSSRGATVTGVDIGAGVIEAAKALAPDIAFQVADAEALPFEDANFDAVTSTFGVMFVAQPQIAARELARVCKKGGRLAGCGKSRDFGKMVMKRARSGNPGIIKSTGYEGAKTNELGWKQHRPTFSAAC